MSENKIQQDNKLYTKRNYMTVQRWSTYSRVISETMEINPKTILEIGPGNNIVTDTLRKMKYKVKTADFDKLVNPDYVIDIEKISELKKFGKFDLIIASQVMEHISYNSFKKVMRDLAEITNNLIITMPYTTKNSIFFSIVFKIPFFKTKIISSKIIYKKIKHEFNGLHYWEIGKIEYPFKKILGDILSSGWTVEKKYLNPEYSYHYIFSLKHKKHKKIS